MDPLQIEIERLVVGANNDLDLGNQPAADWLAETLKEIYARYPNRASGVKVRTLTTDSLEIESAAGMTRKLFVADGKTWELQEVATKKAQSPGQISIILANL